MKKYHRVATHFINSILILCILLIPLTYVSAQNSDNPEESALEVLEDDVFLTGDTITIDGPIDGDVVAIGRTITISDEVSGSIIAIGRDIVIEDGVDGSVYVGGLTLTLGEDANIGRSVYFLGLRLLTEPEAIINRDLTVLSISASLSGSVGRNLNTIIGLLDIISNFGNEQIPGEEDIELDSNGSGRNIQPAYKRTFSKFDHTGMIQSSMAEDIQFASSAPAQISANYSQSLKENDEEPPIPEWLSSSLDTFVTLFVFGLLAIWIIPSWVEKSVDKLRTKPLQSTGYGLLGLVISVNMVGVVVLLGVIIGAIGFFLGIVLIWALAWSVWAIGFSSLAIATTIFAIFVLFISKVIVAYFIGWIILNRISPKISKYKVLNLLLGLLIYVGLILIPYLGWAIGILVTALGVGAGFMAYLQHRKDKKEGILSDDQPVATDDSVAENQSKDSDEDEDNSQEGNDTENKKEVVEEKDSDSDSADEDGDITE